MDLGCGGGRNAGELLKKYPGAHVTAVDYSALSVQKAKELKPGGCFMICNESDGTDAASLKFEKIIDGMKNHTAEEIAKALRAAGFSEVSCDHHPAKPWITVIARK